MDMNVGLLLLLRASSVIVAIVGGGVKLPGGTEIEARLKLVPRVILFSAGGFCFIVALGSA